MAIEILKTKNVIHIKGHSNFSKYGTDIVCASVSILSINLINSIEKLTNDKIDYTINHGDIFIKYENLSTEGKMLISSFFIGIDTIKTSYDKYITIIDRA